MKEPKIVYINGYGGTGGKAKKIAKIINKPIDSIVIDWDKFNSTVDKEVRQKIKDGGYDVILASSTGGYYARAVAKDLGLGLISLNPVIDIDKTFSKIDRGNKKIPNIKYFDGPLDEIVLVNKDDALIDYKDTQRKFKNTKVYNSGGHRFENLPDIKVDVLKFLKNKRKI